MSITAMEWARRQDTGTPTTKFVLWVLANYADDQGYCWPAQTTVAHDTLFSERTVRDALRKLEQDGFIRRRARRIEATQSYTSDVITLVMRGPGSTPVADPSPKGRSVLSHRQLPPEPPADDDRPTGNCLQTHRQMAPNPPAAPAGKPSLEPSYEPSRRTDSCSTGVEPPADVSDRPSKQVSESRRRAEVERLALFERFWAFYPRKVGKGGARRIFDRLIRTGAVSFDALMAGLDRYVNKRDDRDWCVPVTWLNQERWSDEAPVPVPVRPKEAAAARRPIL